MLAGRGPELERIGRLLEAAREGRSDALVLRGAPGAGKTALVLAAVERAEGMTILRATGFESEASLEFSGLVEVCRPLVDVLDELAEPHRRALAGPLGLAEPAEESHDRFTIAGATLSLLAAGAERGPMLVIVDDAHWLDGESLGPLLFAARRLTVDPVAFLFATRPEGLERSGLDELEVGGLDPRAATEVVAMTVGESVPPDVLDRLVAATGGSPLGLVELPRLLSPAQLEGREPIVEPFTAGAAITRAFAGELGSLSAEARLALAVLSASDGHELAPALDALGQLGVEPAAALRSCEDEGVVTITAGHFAFRHPLLRAAAYESVTPSVRRDAHRALAEAADVSVEHRAWHLARAAVGPDDAAAAALAEVAVAARARSAPATAALALERASGLTTDPARRHALLADAAEAAWEAGLADRSLAHARTLVDDATADTVMRARALRTAGRAELQRGDVEVALVDLVGAADALASVDPPRAANALYFACLAHFNRGRIAEQIELARRATEIDGPETQSGRTVSCYMLGQALTMAGRSDEARPWLELALGSFLEGEVASTRVAARRAAFCLFLLGRSGEAAVLAEAALAESRAVGPLEVVWALTTLARILFQTGDWTRAASAAEEGVELARALAQEGTATELLLLLARLDAARGDETALHDRLAAATPHVERSGSLLNLQESHWARGRLALATDTLDEAVAELERCVDAVSGMGMIERELAPEPDLVEALVRRGDAEQARIVLRRWLERGAGGASPWAPPLICTLEALVDDGPVWGQTFERALELHAGLGDPYLEARTRLVYGERLRRGRRRADSRSQLREAHRLFETLGCRAWATRAARELRASGERLRSAAEAGDELTPQELQIALQVAEGKANKQVAAAMFLSPKTVEFHLSRIYRKLGVGSRTELVRALSDASR